MSTISTGAGTSFNEDRLAKDLFSLHSWIDWMNDVPLRKEVHHGKIRRAHIVRAGANHRDRSRGAQNVL
jgi:hypothetical protein